MPQIHVTTHDREYDIQIERGCLKRTGSVAAGLTKGRKAFVFSDDNVGPLYFSAVKDSLKEAGFKSFSYMLPHGEEQKNIHNLQRVYRLLSETGMTRTDLIIVVGGGVCGDLVGFAAATWLRGVPYMQIPTSLLAQVDSSVGGKTAIDMPFGKNMVGSFYQPFAVLIDPDTLRTLPEKHIAEGMAEVIKYGCIKDSNLFERVAVHGEDSYDEAVISHCVKIKAEVVQADERDTGERMLLNFGHTLGHAIEKSTGYSIYSHGQAVAAGMCAAAEIGEFLGLTQKGTAEKIKAAVGNWNLPLKVAVTADELLSAMRADKKNLSGTLNFILLETIGKAFIHPLSVEELERCVRAVWRED